MKVISILLIAVSIIFVSTGLRAQISFGPLAAVQYSSSVGGYSYIKYQWEYGYRFGSFILFPVNKSHFISSGLEINSEAYKYQYTSANNNGSSSSTVFLHNTYLEVPLLWKKVYTNGLHAEGGGFISYQLSQHSGEETSYQEVIDSNLFYGQSSSDEHSVTCNRWQAGVMAGFGYLKSRFDLSVNSQLNLTSLFAVSQANYQKQHFFALSLALAYYIE